MITFFSLHFFSPFRGYRSLGVLLYSLRFLWGLFDLNFGLGGSGWRGGADSSVFFLLVLTLFVVLYDYGVQEDFFFFSDIASCGASSWFYITLPNEGITYLKQKQ